MALSSTGSGVLGLDSAATNSLATFPSCLDDIGTVGHATAGQAVLPGQVYGALPVLPEQC